MTNTEEFDGEIFEVAIEDPDVRPQAVAEVETTIVEDETEEPRLLLLTRGRSERRQNDVLVEAQGIDDGQHRLLVTPEDHGAIGLFLNVLEQHGLDEDGVLESMAEVSDMGAYNEWVDGLSMDDRRERLLEQSRGRADRSPHVKRYLEEGSWREVTDSKAVRVIGERILEGIELNPRSCYRNAIVAGNSLRDLDGLRYGEGMALPKQAGRPVAHSWLEYEGSVIEVTWPWHMPVPPSETLYYGVTLPIDEAVSKMKARGGFSPLFLTAEELFEQ